MHARVKSGALCLLLVAQGAWAQSPDPFREEPAPPPSASKPRQYPEPQPEPKPEPVIVAPQAVPTSTYDGTWVGLRHCPDFRSHVAFQHSFAMRIANGRASSLNAMPADEPGYLTFDGTVEPSGKLVLHGYGISPGLAGRAPRGTQVAFNYEGVISGDTYTARDLDLRQCTLELSRQH